MLKELLPNGHDTSDDEPVPLDEVSQEEYIEDVVNTKFGLREGELAGAWKVHCDVCRHRFPRLLWQDPGERHPAEGDGPQCPDCGSPAVVLEEIAWTDAEESFVNWINSNE